MNKTEIKTAAKELVADKGAYPVLEFGGEFLEDVAWVNGWTPEDVEAIVIEANKQAERVLVFLGL